jgi:ribosome maturation factor RimP
MIEKKTVCQIVEEWLEGKDYFLVEVTVSPDDKIVVEIDHAEGVWIEDCVELSRFIESKLNREEEDYELEARSLPRRFSIACFTSFNVVPGGTET